MRERRGREGEGAGNEICQEKDVDARVVVRRYARWSNTTHTEQKKASIDAIVTKHREIDSESERERARARENNEKKSDKG